MDQHARQRSRGFRTMGRLAAPSSDDVVLAQWPQPPDTSFQRRDVAIASGWSARSAIPPPRIHRDRVDPLSLFSAYDEHHRCVVRRLLEAVDQELQGGAPGALTFESPATSQADLLSCIAAAASDGDLPMLLASDLQSRTIAAGEAAARLWAIIELYRAGLLSPAELAEKKDIIISEIDNLPPLMP
ncbi:MAG: hypothetical protein AB7V46_09790 [Thermomicrobiales bacterium]